MTHTDMADRSDLGIFVQRAHPEHDNVGFRGHVGVDMRTTVRTKTTFLARRRLVFTYLVIAANDTETISGSGGARAVNGAVDLATGMTMTVLKALNFSRDFVLHALTMAATGYHGVFYVCPVVI